MGSSFAVFMCNKCENGTDIVDCDAKDEYSNASYAERGAKYTD